MAVTLLTVIDLKTFNEWEDEKMKVTLVNGFRIILLAKRIDSSKYAILIAHSSCNKAFPLSYRAILIDSSRIFQNQLIVENSLLVLFLKSIMVIFPLILLRALGA